MYYIANIAPLTHATSPVDSFKPAYFSTPTNSTVKQVAARPKKCTRNYDYSGL